MMNYLNRSVIFQLLLQIIGSKSVLQYEQKPTNNLATFQKEMEQ